MRVTSLALGLALGLTACATRGGLDRSVSYGDPTHVALKDVPVKGFLVDVDVYEGDGASGELLAVYDDGLWVLTDKGTRWVPKRSVRTVSVKLYRSPVGELVAWTFVGTLSTVSHGFFLVFTAPAWVLVGVTTALNASQATHLDVHQRDAPKLWQFARFPAGLPVGWRDPRPAPLPPMVPDDLHAPVEPPPGQGPAD